MTPNAQVNCLPWQKRSTVTPPACTALIGGILGFAWFIVVLGPLILNPTYLSWIIQGDGAQHVLGWLFFRHEPWSWPLGSVPSFPYPVGTTIGYTDSIPWLAIPAKVVSPFLPVDFQYVGLWLGLCFFLQGWFGVRILQKLSANRLIQVLGGSCFMLDPVLLWRIGHDSLCAHWLVLGLIWLHLRSWPVGRTPRRALAITLGFCRISGGVHPYLATMVLALGLALLWKLCWIDHRLSTRQSSKVTLAGQPILTLGHFYRPFMEIVAPFRTSGRFIWPLHYLWITVTVALWIIFYHSSRFIISMIFIAVIIVQIIDFRGPVL